MFLIHATPEIPTLENPIKVQCRKNFVLLHAHNVLLFCLCGSLASVCVTSVNAPDFYFCLMELKNMYLPYTEKFMNIFILLLLIV